MNFKRTRALATLGMTAVLTLGTMPLPAKADDDLQSRVNEAYAQLMALSQEAEVAGNSLYAVKQDLAATQEKIAATKQEIAEKQEELKENQVVLSERLAKNYKQDDVSILSLILSSTDFGELLSNVFYANRYAERDREAINAVRTTKEELEEKQSALVEQEAKQKELVSEQEAKTAEVTAKADASQSYYEGLDAELQEQLANEKALAAAAKAAQEAAEKEAANNNGGGGNGGTAGGGDDRPADDGDDDGGYVPPAAPDPEPSTPSGGGTDSGSAPASVVDYALSLKGAPYQLGAAGPTYYDCSGLTMWAYAQCGISIPHSSQAQYNMVVNAGHLVGVDYLKPGDLVFYGSSGWVNHVAIYIGGGQVMHAINYGIPAGVTSIYYGGVPLGGGSPV